MEVRPLESADWSAVWHFLEPVLRAGDTYGLAPDIDEVAAWHYWVATATASYVAATADGAVVGTYYLRPNAGGPGAHVCNCGYVVASTARGQGVAARMCEHSQAEARRFGFRAMQYNLVAATNTAAVRLWQRQGFHIAGTLPGAFAHPEHGPVDAYVMYKSLAV